MIRLDLNWLRSSATILCLLAAAFTGQIAANAQVSVLTQHNDNLRTGGNLGETTLNTTNVNVASFGKLFSLPVDGFTYAQPLYMASVAIAGGVHNVLFVATAHDSIYAFDADTGAKLWQTSLGTPVPSLVINTPDIQIEVGIISTPVIDPVSGTLYAVAKTYENGVQIFRLHALSITTGAELGGSPVLISALVNGTGDANDGNGHVPFVAAKENQRAAVTLVNGVLYLAFASHEDYDPYHGWVLAYSESTLQQLAAFNLTPNGGRGGVWMGGQGLLADSNGFVYLISGNSTQSEEHSAEDFGESFLKLGFVGNTLLEIDYFKANNYDFLNAFDIDLGSGGAVGIPGTTQIVGGGKQGFMYLVDTTNMGQLSFGADRIVEEWQADNGLFGSPIFWNSFTPTLYVWAEGDSLNAYRYNAVGGLFATSTSSRSTFISSAGTGCIGLAVSSNGSAAKSGIVWAAIPSGNPDKTTVPGTLYAFDATDVSRLLWSSKQNAVRDSFGNFAKFVPPTVANGKVYVGTDSGQVCVYGELSSDFTLSAVPATLSVALNGFTTTTVTVADLNGFSGSVALSASGLPTGVTASFSPNSTTGTSVLTVTASSGATIGNSVITVTGSSGSLIHTTTIPLSVTAAGPGVSFPAGLQLFSAPDAYPGVGLDTLFGYSGVKLYVWSPLTVEYAATPTAPADQIVLGQGYWGTFPQAVTLTASGIPASVAQNFDILLKKGWNMIGDPFFISIPLANLTFNNGSVPFAKATSGTNPLVAPVLWNYSQVTKGYTAASSLSPEQGCWIYAISNTDVQVPHP